MRKITAKKELSMRSAVASPDVARLLHDGVCQTLTAVQLLAKVLIRKMESEKSTEVSAAPELNELLQKAREELASALKQLGDGKPHD